MFHVYLLTSPIVRIQWRVTEVINLFTAHVWKEDLSYLSTPDPLYLTSLSKGQWKLKIMFPLYICHCATNIGFSCNPAQTINIRTINVYLHSWSCKERISCLITSFKWICLLNVNTFESLKNPWLYS